MSKQLTLTGEKSSSNELYKCCDCCKKRVSCDYLNEQPWEVSHGYCCICFAKECTDVPQSEWLKYSELFCESCLKKLKAEGSTK